MLLLGHIGITAGAVKVCELLGVVDEVAEDRKPGSMRISPWRLLGKIRDKIGLVDYRLVILSSLLPDIVDKPLWFFTGMFASGRDFSHTFLFNLALLIGGIALVRRGKSWLLVVSLASFMHLILDEIWKSPATLWWPLLGPFPEVETATWLPNIWRALISDPGVYIPEAIGFIIIVVFACKAIAGKGVTSFIRTGVIG